MNFNERAATEAGGPLRAAGTITTLQVNIGYRCNLSCKHCHFEAGPSRAEMMGPEDIDAVIAALEARPALALDITGGAPEMHAELRRLVASARALGTHVTCRTNLTALLEPGAEGLMEFYAAYGVEVIASLPAYSAGPVDRVRGGGTFERSIEAMRALNALGYADGTGKRALHLIHNPAGAFLPPRQETIEAGCRAALDTLGVRFDRLFTITNMPIGRFAGFLKRMGQLDAYMERLRGAFNPCVLDALMCRRLVSVGPDGRLYDCDFNQALGIPIAGGGSIGDVDMDALAERLIVTGEHCWGCAAGSGST